jgi:thioesterase domain-containing protein
LKLRPEGEGRPLFLMPSIGGQLLFSKKLLDKLRIRSPVLGFETELAPRNLEQVRDFRTTAGHIVVALQEYQPHGPYALAGFSYGGFLAFEVACQLNEIGETVDLLAMIDAGPEWRGLQQGVGERVKKLSRIVVNLPFWLREELRDFTARRFIADVRRKLRYLGRSLRSVEQTKVEFDDVFDVSSKSTQNRELMRTVFAAIRDYKPRFYSGKLTLIRATTRPLLSGSSPDLGWSRFVDALDVRHIKGNHLTILHPPHVSELARQLGELLDALESMNGATNATAVR